MEIGSTEEFFGALAGTALGSLVMMIACSFALSFFVGLNSPPAKRALLTVSPAYVIAVMIGVFGGPPVFSWIWPIGAIPSALALYGYLCWHYGRTWFADEAGLPDGVAPAETDWRNGLLKLFALIVVAILVLSMRTIIRLI